MGGCSAGCAPGFWRRPAGQRCKLSHPQLHARGCASADKVPTTILLDNAISLPVPLCCPPGPCLLQLKDGTTFSSVHIEARMQLPEPGQGLWPAFWLFPTELTYGKWAASGEIDIMESINDMETIAQGLHFGGPGERSVWTLLPFVFSFVWDLCEGPAGLGWAGDERQTWRIAKRSGLGGLSLQLTAAAAAAACPALPAVACHCRPSEPEEHDADPPARPLPLLRWLPHYGGGLGGRQDYE